MDPPDLRPVDGAGLAPPGGQGRRLFRNTLFNGLGTLAGMVGGFLLLPVLIDHLGPPAYGVWVLALSFSVSSGYLTLSDLGLQQSIVKHVAEADATGDRRRVNEFVSTALAILLLMGLAGLGLLALISLAAARLFEVPAQLAPALRTLFLVIAMEAAVGVPGLAFLGLIEGLQRYGAIRLIQVAQQLTFIVLAVAAVVADLGVVALGVALLTGTALTTLGYQLAARRYYPELKLSLRLVSWPTLQILLRFGGWVFVGKVVGVVWRQMDKVILALLLTTSVLAAYDVAAKLERAGTLILSLTCSAIVPAASALAAGRRSGALMELLRRGTRYSVALAAPVVVGAMILMRPLIVSWVGPGFADIAAPARLLLAHVFLTSTSAVANTMLLGLGLARAVTLRALAAAALNLGLSIALAPTYGISGVIVGTLAGSALAAPLYLQLALKELDVRLVDFLRDTVAPMIPWAAAFAVTVAFTRHVFPPTNLIAVFAVCLPGFALYLLGVGRFAMSADERSMILGLLRPTSHR